MHRLVANDVQRLFAGRRQEGAKAFRLDDVTQALRAATSSSVIRIEYGRISTFANMPLTSTGRSSFGCGPRHGLFGKYLPVDRYKNIANHVPLCAVRWWADLTVYHNCTSSRRKSKQGSCAARNAGRGCHPIRQILSIWQSVR